MDFEFGRFSTRSFEHFAQALAVQFLGPGIRVYGDGPDGAREATYQGKLDFPTDGDSWDGYTVVQAKFHQHAGSAGEDAAWLARELREELEKFTENQRGLKRPEYYLLITNARLSPAPKTARGAGGIHKIDEVFAEYASLGIRDYRVWHYDELCARLAAAENIRRAFLAWTTPSDILATLMDKLSFDRPDFGNLMHRFLQREVRNQRTTRLQQAGHGGDTGTNLDEIFIDLPFVDHSGGVPSAGELLVESLARRSAERLRPSDLKSSGNNGPRPDRFLLLGAPGQGKSTVSQFFAQLLRASLLASETRKALSADIDSIVRRITRDEGFAGICAKMPRRFPLRVELPIFADRLAAARESGAAFSLLDYLGIYIAETTQDQDVRTSDLRRWLINYPFVLLLDGLDEVPPSGNRDEVIRAINEFWDEVTTADADLLMLVTTRPQGYNDDLDPSLYTKLELSKLEATHALAFADRLAEVRLPDPIQRGRVLERLREASRSNTTAHLLVSPLQVAIMIALIDQRGEAPSDRWTLFDKYFNVVLEREQQKLGAAGRTVKTWARMIGALHQRVGFKLHLAAESGGGADAQLTRAELHALVAEQLRLEGFNGEKLAAASAELFEATTDRLVLLVQRVDQNYSFEVRSLQEFMAAAFLMSGREAAVQERLREIANKSHWRHVFLIAASKCFSSNDALHYRDTVLAICRELDTGAPIDSKLRTGARLALALLDDGLAHDQPRARRQLIISALENVHTGAEPDVRSLAAKASEDPEASAAFLKPHMRSSEAVVRLGSWRVVLSAAAAGEAWADELATAAWPTGSDALSIVALGMVPPAPTPLRERIRLTIETEGPEAIARAVPAHSGLGEEQERLNELCPGLRLLWGRWTGPNVEIRLGDTAAPVSMQIVSVEPTAELLEGYDSLPSHPAWDPLRRLAQFHRKAGAAELADMWRDIEQNGWADILNFFPNLLPWPLLTLLLTRQLAPVASLAEAVAAGDFGDIEDWRAAEERWRNDGLVEKDFAFLASGNLPDREIGTRGFGWPNGASMTHGHEPVPWLDILIEYGRSAHGVGGFLIRWIIRFCLTAYRPTTLLGEDTVVATVLKDPSEGPTSVFIEPSIFSSFSEEALASEAVLEDLDERGRNGKVWTPSQTFKVDELWPRLIAERAEARPGLIPILLNAGGTEEAKWQALSSIQAAVQAHAGHENPRVSAAANVIRFALSRGLEGDLEPILEEADPTYGRQHLFDLIRHGEMESPQAVELTLALLRDEVSHDKPKFSSVLSHLARLADSRQSALHDPARQAELEIT